MAAIFSRGMDATIRNTAFGLTLGAALFVAGFYYYAYPQYTRVGYQPEQPVPFSHELHVGRLGMDCRYCHQHVENSKHAGVPNTQVCMGCHNPEKANIKGTSPLLSMVRESWKTGNSIPWKRVHKLPDYAYFDHSIHVARGVGCVECHGPIHEMKTVRHDQSLTMGWCLDCHHQPELHLRPKADVFNPRWKPPEGTTQPEAGNNLRNLLGHNAPSHCGACHR